ncbi:LacI family DNA-binding transcriptional regulator [Paenarthrobacter histidinolovorans]|uniref:LacI family transcriptional regulator n=1 Tax=Paenarthrobacter histidinolovorans TaxID=43664 RepID=A0ABW8N7C2_9MICC
MARTTLADVSRHAGVSRSTASLVLNNSPEIPESTKVRVRASMAELGYVYNRRAASLRNQKSMALGLVVTEIRNPYFAELAMTLEDVAYAYGYALFVCYSRDNVDRQEVLIARLLERGIDGLVLLPAAATAAGNIDQLLEASRTPLVLLARHFGLQHDYVGADNRLAGELLGRHLGAIGTKNVAMIGGPSSTSASLERSEGLATGLAGSGVQFTPPLRFSGPTTAAGGAAATAALLDQGSLPDAIVAFSDVTAVGVYAELSARGLEPGRDVAVAGFDDIPSSAHQVPPLTTVATFPASIGEKCAELILERIADDRPAGLAGGEDLPHILIRPELRIRASTASWRPRTTL